jgi:hypothetical protein
VEEVEDSLLVSGLVEADFQFVGHRPIIVS